MRTNVPRNSATSSATKPGFEVIASPGETAYLDREVVYQADEPARLIFFDVKSANHASTSKLIRFSAFENKSARREAPNTHLFIFRTTEELL
jgi:hypothetical protein